MKAAKHTLISKMKAVVFEFVSGSSASSLAYESRGFQTSLSLSLIIAPYP